MTTSHLVAEHVGETIAHAKPHLRGWLHLWILPLTLVGGLMLVALSPDAETPNSSSAETVKTADPARVSASGESATSIRPPTSVNGRIQRCSHPRRCGLA